MDEVYCNLPIVVSKRAEFPVLAVNELIGVLLAEFALVAAGVVQLLNFIVSSIASISVRALPLIIAHHMLVV